MRISLQRARWPLTPHPVVPGTGPQTRVTEFPSLRVDKFSFAWKEVRGKWRAEGGPKDAHSWESFKVSYTYVTLP
eukprot:6620413-Pyramimonas_sp.AAC.1